MPVSAGNNACLLMSINYIKKKGMGGLKKEQTEHKLTCHQRGKNKNTPAGCVCVCVLSLLFVLHPVVAHESPHYCTDTRARPQRFTAKIPSGSENLF